MYKETVTYVDYDGNERTEDFYFNFTKAEIMELQVSEDGGLEKYIQKITAARDPKKILEVFKDVVTKAYGVKSPDGRKFIKNPEVLEEFTQTEAYSIIFTKFAMDDEAAAAFINGVIPKPDKTPEPKNNK